MTFMREHDAANHHPLKIKREADAETAVRRAEKADLRQTERLRANAERFLEEASNLEHEASRHTEYETKSADAGPHAPWPFAPLQSGFLPLRRLQPITRPPRRMLDAARAHELLKRLIIARLGQIV